MLFFYYISKTRNLFKNVISVQILNLINKLRKVCRKVYKNDFKEHYRSGDLALFQFHFQQK